MNDERMKWFLYGYLLCAVLDIAIQIIFHTDAATVLEFPTSENGVASADTIERVKEFTHE